MTSKYTNKILNAVVGIAGPGEKMIDLPAMRFTDAAGLLSRFAEQVIALSQKVAVKLVQLDPAQIIKHYLGLRHTFRSDARRLHLLYLYWEPANADSLLAFQEHREQVSAFARHVSGSVVHFHGMSYRQLWERWESVPGIVGHVHNLRARYDFPIVA
jgi:hypothetical protein